MLVAMDAVHVKPLIDFCVCVCGFAVIAVRTPCRYWQLDLLTGMLHEFNQKALKIQAFFRGHLARKKYAVMKAKYIKMLQEIAMFLEKATTRSEKLHTSLLTLMDEEMRKGPVKLGIAPKPGSKPKPAKAKIVTVKEIEKAVKKRQVDMSKVKKKIVKWWIKSEEKKNCHVNDAGEFFPWFHGVIGSAFFLIQIAGWCRSRCLAAAHLGGGMQAV